MKAYISDTEDLKLDPSYQETWDDMIINVRESVSDHHLMFMKKTETKPTIESKFKLPSFLSFGLKFLAESLDVIQDADWVIFLGNAFTNQYELYINDDEHSALLHR